MGREASRDPPEPSSSRAEKELSTLTMINKSNKRPRSPDHKLNIKKAKLTCLDEDAGEVHVPIRDLLRNAAAGHVKSEVLRYEVKSSSGETEGVLQFYCELVPPPAKKVGEPVTVSPAATAPLASYMAAADPPPTGAAPPPSWYSPVEPVTDYTAGRTSPASNPATAHLPRAVVAPSAAEPVADYPAATALLASNPAATHLPPTEAAPPSSGNPSAGYTPGGYPPSGMPNAASNSGHPPPAGYPPNPVTLQGYPPRANVHPPNRYGRTVPAGYSSGVYPPSGMPNAVSNYGYPPPAGYRPNPAVPQGYPTCTNMHPPAGYGCAAPAGMPNAASNYGYPPPTGYPPNLVLPQGYPTRANIHPPAGYGHVASAGYLLSGIPNAVSNMYPVARYWPPAPPPHAGWDIWPRALTEVVASTISNWFDSVNNTGSADWLLSNAWDASS
ncbi:hypothetical protein BT93_B1147 [Corymbia citriodora subsp. variegata]|nr:hypothetical protein BT93_B1147 [Corymbia citriodora subsp. variegata]